MGTQLKGILVPVPAIAPARGRGHVSAAGALLRERYPGGIPGEPGGKTMGDRALGPANGGTLRLFHADADAGGCGRCGCQAYFPAIPSWPESIGAILPWPAPGPAGGLSLIDRYVPRSFIGS